VRTLTHEEAILVSALLATVDGAAVCLINPETPVSELSDIALWWEALGALSSPQQTVALFSLPPARALGTTTGRQVLDLQISEVVNA
jgi:hypothetical protein